MTGVRRRLAGEGGQHVEAARAFHAHVGDDQIVAPVLRRARWRRRRRRPPRPRSLRRAGSRTADRGRRDRPRRPARASGAHARPPARCPRRAAGDSATRAVPGAAGGRRTSTPCPAALSTEMVPPSAARQLRGRSPGRGRCPCRAPWSCRTARRCAADRRAAMPWPVSLHGDEDIVVGDAGAPRPRRGRRDRRRRARSTSRLTTICRSRPGSVTRSPSVGVDLPGDRRPLAGRHALHDLDRLLEQRAAARSAGAPARAAASNRGSRARSC